MVKARTSRQIGLQAYSDFQQAYDALAVNPYCRHPEVFILAKSFEVFCRVAELRRTSKGKPLVKDGEGIGATGEFVTQKFMGLTAREAWENFHHGLVIGDGDIDGQSKGITFNVKTTRTNPPAITLTRTNPHCGRSEALVFVHLAPHKATGGQVATLMGWTWRDLANSYIRTSRRDTNYSVLRLNQINRLGMLFPIHKLLKEHVNVNKGEISHGR